jgi:predicted TIM-barrel fold metal-dependent hydrolase
LHPGTQNPIESLKKSKDLGFLGIGECHPWLQGSSIQNDNWMNCMQFACDQGWPVTFHVTEPVGHDYPGRVQTPLEEFLWLARQLPALKIILAHAGGLFPFYELNPKIRPELKNVYYDLAACPLLYDPSIYRKLIETVGMEKILWGTDYPLRIFPATQKVPDFKSFQNLISKEANLTDVERTAIFGTNFLSLL